MYSLVGMTIVAPTKEHILTCAQLLRTGGVVAFPTETVYGLGANAFDPQAVAYIFRLKGRPADNPLIVHIRTSQDLTLVAKEIPEVAERLAKAFWPGPLTLILQKKENIPPIVSGGLSTVAVRVPANRVARALIRAAGIPIAAPSANISGTPSPTTALHVAADFGNDLVILDGGETMIGLESTVLDCTVSPPTILRQGGVTLEALQRIVPEVRCATKLENATAKSPGMRYRHYAPKSPMIIAYGAPRVMTQWIKDYIATHQHQRVGVLGTDAFRRHYTQATAVVSLGSRRSLSKVARRLFAALREFDTLSVDVIIAESFPPSGIGGAIMERLIRATTFNI